MMTPFTQNRTDSIHANGEESSFFGAGVSQMTDEAQARLKDAGDIVKTMITNRPALALGAALAAGVFLGWLIKRR
jgi:ElaB/YqjD/DUF883 family membrane-anchored ribosome-binding protein